MKHANLVNRVTLDQIQELLERIIPRKETEGNGKRQNKLVKLCKLKKEKGKSIH